MTNYGVILMGGKALRLHGLKKYDIKVGSTTCFQRVLARLQPVCNEIILSAASPDQFTQDNTEFSVLYDSPAQSGLDGVSNALLTIMNWGVETGCNYIVTSTADTPFLPELFTEQLNETFATAGDEARPVVSVSSGRIHGLHALWPRAAFQTAINLIENEGVRSITNLHKQLNSIQQEFSADSYDPFFNINSPEDLKMASQIAKTYGV